MAPNHDLVVLTLEVTGPEAQRLGTASRRQFGIAGGTIGRADSNDWVLPHSLVSGHHATIECIDHVFYITDTSTNGVFLGSKKNRLPKGQRWPIGDGDELLIEPFHLHAAILQGAVGEVPGFDRVPGLPRSGAAHPTGDDPFRAAEDFRPVGGAPEPVDAGQAEELDPLKLLGVATGPRVHGGVPRAQDLEASSPLVDHFQPPAAAIDTPKAARAPLIPDDYDPLQEVRDDDAVAPESVSPPLPQPVPARREGRAESGRADGAGHRDAAAALAEVLAAAGLEHAPVTPQLASNLGAILRVVVAGVMDVMRSRQQIKDEFRMRATRFQAEDNNPLKFSANVSDALHNLLVKQNPAYLKPVEAFEDAFDDLRNHQVAMLAGLRAAFDAMLAEFDPDRLQAQFDPKVKKSVLGGGAEAQYWRMYRDRVQELTKDVEAAFRTLFGERFVNAYEEQLDRVNPPKQGGRR